MRQPIFLGLVIGSISLLQAADKALSKDIQELQEFKQYVQNTMNETSYSTPFGEQNIDLAKQSLKSDKETIEREISHADNAHLAMLKLAVLYEVVNEKKLAEYWYMNGAYMGDPLALFACGCFYEKIGKNKQAQECYEELFNKGFPYAAIKMGRLLERHQEFEGALSWYQKAAPEKRDAIFRAGLIQEHLGRCADAKNSFKDAAQWGHLQAMLKCGEYAEREKEVDSMLCWYKFAAKNGSVEAYCRMGKYYQAQGDHDLAEQYFIPAAQMGSTLAMHELDIIHIKKNLKAGDPHAMVLFGMLNERQGNYDSALQCYFFAHRHGHSPASEHIDRVKSILQELQSQQRMQRMWAHCQL